MKNEKLLDEKLYWLGFSAFSGIGPMKFQSLLNRFGSAKAAWEAKEEDLSKVLGEKLASKLNRFRKEFSIDLYSNDLKKKNVSFFTLQDKEYPELLKKIKKPPFVLYVKGKIEILSKVQDDIVRSIAVVGTRRTTSYGREVTRMITTDLVHQRFIIISGLAIGVDAVAHKTALDAEGKTIAVLGCGVDCCNPRENLRLYNEIIQKGGAIVSELPLGHPPTKGSFPARNRIIAGLSLGVLVTEGAEDSGSLITADYAFRNNLKVFAVPGPITSHLSKGPYKLLEKGAKLVTKGEDILKEFQMSNVKFPISNKRNIKGDPSTALRASTKEERKVLDALLNEPLSFDDLVRRTKFDSSKLGSLLSMMEVKGMVRSLETGIFTIA